MRLLTLLGVLMFLSRTRGAAMVTSWDFPQMSFGVQEECKDLVKNTNRHENPTFIRNQELKEKFFIL